MLHSYENPTPDTVDYMVELYPKADDEKRVHRFFLLSNVAVFTMEHGYGREGNQVLLTFSMLDGGVVRHVVDEDDVFMNELISWYRGRDSDVG